jgi:hypothetical protein
VQEQHLMVAGLTSHVENSSAEQEVGKIFFPAKIREIWSADSPIVPRFVLYTWSSLHISRHLNYIRTEREAES